MALGVNELTPAQVSAVVCARNSIASIKECLQSLIDTGVGEIVVVDAHSTDGTAQVAAELATTVISDEGIGLGNARNLGIRVSTKALVLNMGSDNVSPAGQLEIMISTLVKGGLQGVSAQTRIQGSDYLAQGLNLWRAGRFAPGPVAVIGTPTLFDAELLRSNPYDATRKFSDDSELCERWENEFGARFAISSAVFLEVGKTNWDEIKIRARMYGVSDAEVYRCGVKSGWTHSRRAVSILHPLRVDFLEPLGNAPIAESMKFAPFLGVFTALRYTSWAKSMTKSSARPTGGG